MIASIQLTNTEIFASISVLILKLLTVTETVKK